MSGQELAALSVHVLARSLREPSWWCRRLAVRYYWLSVLLEPQRCDSGFSALLVAAGRTTTSGGACTCTEAEPAGTHRDVEVVYFQALLNNLSLPFYTKTKSLIENSIKSGDYFVFKKKKFTLSLTA